MTTTPNTGMAVLMDAESVDCIHPPGKKEAGERMARWALAETYGMEMTHYRSPEVKSFDVEGRMAVVTFDYTGSTGLTSRGREILNFTVAGADRRFHPAEATLAGDRVDVFSPDVAEPEAVRYCFDDVSGAEIFTVEGGLPLPSFRTDDW
jgi:sialate O-acetylesterase